MLECKDIDAQMMDWLYDELDDTSSAPFAEHIDNCARCQTELDSLTRTRAALRELPDDDPSPSITQILLHEAAKRAPAKRARAASMSEDDDKPGVFAWLFGWMKPAFAHPAIAAVATLVLVAGVAGSLYVRGKGRTSEPVSDKAKRAPASSDTQPSMLPGADMPARQRELGDNYEARLADEGYDVGDKAAAAKPNIDVDGDDGIAIDPEPELAVEEQVWEAESGNARAEDRAKQGDLAEHAPKVPAPGNKGKKTGGSTSTPPATNAVTTADPLLDAEDYDFDDDMSVDDSRNADKDAKEVAERDDRTSTKAGKSTKKDKKKKSEKKKPAKKSRDKTADSPPPADNAPSGGEGGADANEPTYRVSKDPQKELEWAQTQKKKMLKLIRAKKCKDAAVIANNILDRNPTYYYKNIDKSADIKRCQWYIVDEQRRRSRARAKNRRSSAGDASDEMVEPMSTE